MARGAKPAKPKVEATPSGARKSRTTDGSTDRHFEQRLAEALEQQAATSEILRVISSTPADLQPVFDAIVRSASRLCGGQHAIVVRVDGELMRLAASYNARPATAMEAVFPRRLGREIGIGRAILDAAPVHIPDVEEDPEYSHEVARALGLRSSISVPLLREGRRIGGIGVSRADPWPFAGNHIELMKTFADQAVMAIENVRLFTELQSRTAELMQSVGELKALGEVGQAVSSTLDLEIVLRTIVSRATTLAGMDGGAIYEYQEAREQFYLHATDKLPDELVQALRAAPIVKGEGVLGRMAVTGEPVEIRDIADEATYQSRVREMLIRHQTS